MVLQYHFWSVSVAWRHDLSSQSGIEPTPPTLEGEEFNHSEYQEVPRASLWKQKSIQSPFLRTLASSSLYTQNEIQRPSTPGPISPDKTSSKLLAYFLFPVPSAHCTPVTLPFFCCSVTMPDAVHQLYRLGLESVCLSTLSKEIFF